MTPDPRFRKPQDRIGFWLVALLAIAAAGSPKRGAHAQDVTYSKDACASICSDPAELEKPLPDKPDPAVGSRPTQWSIVTLNLIKLNVAKLSPPGVGRAVGFVGLCMYEAVSLFRPELKSFTVGEMAGTEFSFSESFAKQQVWAAIDGAAHRANYLLFKDFPGIESNDASLLLLNGADAESPGRRAVDDYLAQGNVTRNMSTDALVMSSGSYGPSAKDLLKAMELGSAACDRVRAKFAVDGFDAMGRPAEGDPLRTFPSMNSPQTRAGVTNCEAEVKDLNSWQPLCVPNELKSQGNVGSEDCTAQEFLAPWAGLMMPFAIQQGGIREGHLLLAGRSPPKHGSSEWNRQMMEVLTISGKLDDLEKLVAEHWADGPDSTLPPGHWWRIAATAADKEGFTSVDAAKLLMAVGLAVYDAGVAAWRVKTTFDYIRPLQMIQCGMNCVGNPPKCNAEVTKLTAWRGPYQGAGEMDTSVWQPYQLDTFKTPPFAAYVSGHSAFSAAAETVMRQFFRGDDSYRAPKCRLFEPGESLFEKKIDAGNDGHVAGVTDVPNTGPFSAGYTPRTRVGLCWETYTAAAEEAGKSRLYGGIHIAADNVDGLYLGREVGKAVYSKVSNMFGGY